jgi:hypothetical protein
MTSHHSIPVIRNKKIRTVLIYIKVCFITKKIFQYLCIIIKIIYLHSNDASAFYGANSVNLQKLIERQMFGLDLNHQVWLIKRLQKPIPNFKVHTYRVWAPSDSYGSMPNWEQWRMSSGIFLNAATYWEQHEHLITWAISPGRPDQVVKNVA